MVRTTTRIIAYLGKLVDPTVSGRNDEELAELDEELEIDAVEVGEGVIVF